MIELFATAVAKDPARPLLTWYDDATGDRTELSGATLDNWVSKTANLLVDGLGLGHGDRAGVLIPPHWQTAAVLLGCWAAGLTVAADEGPVDVLFIAADRLADALHSAGVPPTGAEAELWAQERWPAADRFALGLAPMAMPMRPAPDGFADYVVEVRQHGDHFTPYPTKADEVAVRAGRRAADLGIGAGDRVLIDAAKHPDPLDWLLAPLAAGASVVLCGHLDAARLGDRIGAEKVTVPLV